MEVPLPLMLEGPLHFLDQVCDILIPRQQIMSGEPRPRCLYPLHALGFLVEVVLIVPGVDKPR